ncbi:hypothetical protein SAMN05216581_3335 [Pseudomonas asplenii]|uniref:Uncharacterized protein n=2 Tax=Pseudomonas asplenii TaxID=53407 RepID=A0A1H6NN46_9PSED|nr:hypothetical protein [Pseudomonas fuscovaginae]SEI17231.1 hypothetical protein SAMN05216581_3335 [Pseudomonas fuscovaginae]
MGLLITLGGIPIVLHAGAPDQSDNPLLGESVVRLSGGEGVKMTHWAKAAGSITGQGWMPPGLDGLDYSQPLELRLTLQESVVSEGRAVALTSRPRPDKDPWAMALVGMEWVETDCTVDVDGTGAAVATAGLVVGATRYMVAWLPVYNVFASKPPKNLSTGVGQFGWTINWEEI